MWTRTLVPRNIYKRAQSKLAQPISVELNPIIALIISPTMVTNYITTTPARKLQLQLQL